MYIFCRVSLCNDEMSKSRNLLGFGILKEVDFFLKRGIFRDCTNPEIRAVWHISLLANHYIKEGEVVYLHVNSKVNMGTSKN